MNTFAEASAHAGGEAHAGFAELVAQLVGGSQSVFPALLAVAFEQINLSRGCVVNEDACTPSRPDMTFPSSSSCGTACGCARRFQCRVASASAEYARA